MTCLVHSENSFVSSICLGFQRKLKDSGSSSTTEVEADILRLEQELQELDDQRGLVHGSEKMYHHFIDKMEKQLNSSSDCPLCHREFDDADETLTLIDELKGRVKAMPSKKSDYDRKIAEKKAKHGQLLQLRPVAQSIAKLIDTDIPRLQSELATLESRSSTIQTELRDLEESIEFMKNEEDIGKKAHPDIIQLDALKVSLQKKNTVLYLELTRSKPISFSFLFYRMTSKSCSLKLIVSKANWVFRALMAVLRPSKKFRRKWKPLRRRVGPQRKVSSR